MKKRYTRQSGFILPAIILLGLGIMTASVSLYSIVGNSSQQLNDTSFNQIAREAAQAGVSLATGCVRMEPGHLWLSSLAPDKKCDGTGATGSGMPFVAEASDGSWRSTFEVKPPVRAEEYGPDTMKAVVIGSVQRLQNGTAVGSPYQASRVAIIQPTVRVMANAKGAVATDVKADAHVCSINNGKLYCWGPNGWGMLGTGDFTQRNVPTQVTALGNKFVSKVAVSDSTTCAIADGEPYCWGNNLAGQVGNGSMLATDSLMGQIKNQGNEAVRGQGVAVPQRVGNQVDSSANFGLTLKGRLVTDIGTSPSNTPAPQFIPVFQHTCAVTDGAPYCWGGNDYQQVGSLNCTMQKPNIFQAIINPLNWLQFVNMFLGGEQRFCDNLPFTLGSSTGAIGTSAIMPNPAPPFGYENWKAAPVVSMVASTAKNAVGAFVDPIFNTVGVPGPGSSGWFGLFPPTIVAPDSDTGKLYGRKLDRIGAGSHYSCAITDGKLYCWGIALPFNWGTPIMTLTVQPFNYTGYVPNTAAWQSVLPDSLFNQVFPGGVGYKFDNGLDAEGFSLGGDFVCAPSQRNLGCMGFTPAYSGLLSIASSYLMNAPFRLAQDVDPIGTDDGAWAIPFVGSILGGTYCINDGGTPKCMGVTGGNAIGSDPQFSILGKFQELNKSGNSTSGTPGLNGGPNEMQKVTTSIAAAGLNGALVANGQIFTWGNPTEGQLGDGRGAAQQKYASQLTKDAGNKPFGANPETYAWTAVSTGANHTCGIQNGKMACWGANDKGQLGIGYKDTGTHSEPSTLASVGDKTFTKVSVGARHSCGISKGYLYCWGANDKGQLGVGGAYDTNSYEAQPKRVKTITTNENGATIPVFGNQSRVTAVSAGDTNTCAIADGHTYCWGDNSRGQLGNNNAAMTSSNEPIRVGTYSARQDTGTTNRDKRETSFYNMTTTKLDVGAEHVCAIAQGDGWCWGSNTNGELGNGLTGGESRVPVRITGGTAATVSPEGLTAAFTGISAGKNFSCGIINSITSCWGKNDKGQLGTGFETIQVPVQDPQVQVKRDCAWEDAKGWPWNTPANPNGCDGYDLVGIWPVQSKKGYKYAWEWPPIRYVTKNDATPDKNVPTKVTGDPSMQQALSISAGDEHACAAVNGKTYCWGEEQNGRLGNNKNPVGGNRVPTPRLVGTPGVSNASAEGYGGSMMFEDGIENRQMTTMVSAGAATSCSISNGKMLCWGKNEFGQIGLKGVLSNQPYPVGASDTVVPVNVTVSGNISF